NGGNGGNVFIIFKSGTINTGNGINGTTPGNTGNPNPGSTLAVTTAVPTTTVIAVAGDGGAAGAGGTAGSGGAVSINAPASYSVSVKGGNGAPGAAGKAGGPESRPSRRTRQDEGSVAGSGESPAPLCTWGRARFVPVTVGWGRAAIGHRGPARVGGAQHSSQRDHESRRRSLTRPLISGGRR